MSRRHASLVFLWIFTLSILPALCLADVTDFTVQIPGAPQGPVTCPPTPPGPCEFIISNSDGSAKSYSGFTIAGTSGKVAKVVATDGAVDNIVLRDALITATVAPQASCTNTDAGILNCPSIVFWGTFGPPPTPDPSASPAVIVRVERHASGNILRNPGTPGTPAKDDAIRVTGWLANNEIWGWQKKKVICTIPITCGDFLLAKSEDWTTGLTGNRQMKAQFWFYLKSVNDRLTATEIKVTTTTVAGPPVDISETPLVTCGHEKGPKHEKGSKPEKGPKPEKCSKK
jgi:hypothetical protein